MKSERAPLLLGSPRIRPLSRAVDLSSAPLSRPDKCTIGGPRREAAASLWDICPLVFSHVQPPGEEEVPRDIQAGARGPPRLPVAALIGTIYVRRGSTVFSPRLLDQRPLEFSSFRFARLTIEIPSSTRREEGDRGRDEEMVFRSIAPRVEFNSF